MTVLVPRTVTEIGKDGSPIGREPASDDYFDWGDVLAGDDSTDWSAVLAGEDSGAGSADSPTLGNFRESNGYVLLGAPGAGKTELFTSEGKRDGCHLVTAREFLTFEVRDRPGWRDATLFIDGLDEKRAGSADGRTPLDDIRAKLEALGRPRFRLSCREADWFGSNDRSHLETVSSDGRLKVLRLDPLSDEGIRELLNRRADIDDAGGFVDEARKRGIEYLLANPKNLEMLANAVSGGTWPNSRRETFELACAKLVQEFNTEHQIANPDRPAVFELLDAAGRLCAVLLLTGHTGFQEAGQGDDPGFLELETVPANGRATLRLTLRTRLFESPMEDGRKAVGRSSPVHRQVAEFLAARYIARLIDDGLPVGRVLALMTGEDGGIVSELRGLSAWLAAHCLEARRMLIERDPEGVAAYGDAGVFTRDEKRRLLKCLCPVDPSLDASLYTSLVAPDMAPIFLDLLGDPMQESEHRNLVHFVLCVLANAPPLPELCDAFLDLAVSEDRSPRSRQWAAICLAQGAREQPERFGNAVRSLLSDLQVGRIHDERSSTLGHLLQCLYPTFIGPDVVFDYLDEGHWTNRYIGDRLGPYDVFWQHDLARESRAQDLAIVLDKLEEVFERPKEWRVMREAPASPLARAANVLVKRALFEADSHDSRRTLRWLRLAAGSGSSNQPSASAIRDWIGDRPERYKVLLREGVVQCQPTDGVDECRRRAKRPLHGARVPHDYGRWCLTEIERIGRDGRLARFWFEEAWNALLHGDGADGLTLEDLETTAETNAGLASVHDCLRHTDLHGPLARMEREERRRDADRRRAPGHGFAEWRQSLVRYEAAFPENRCPAGSLNTIAEVFLGHYDIEGENGSERLREFLGDEALVEAAMEGLRGSVFRDDLPTPEEVLALRLDGRRHTLAFPIVAGLELSSADDISRLEDGRARLAIAMFLASRPPSPVPGWVRPLFESRPYLAADEIVRFASAGLRRGERHISFVFEMLDHPWQAEVAKSACPKLLRAFPVRAPEHHCNLLKRLLWWGVANLDAPIVEPIVAGKLAATSMTRAQRAYWTAAHLVLAAKPDPAAIEDFQDRHDSAIGGFFAFYERSPFHKWLLERLPSSLVGRLACLLSTGRRPLSEVRLKPAEIGESDLVRVLIEALGTRAEDEALSALAELENDPRLAAWRTTVRRVRREQRVRRRDARFEHPDVGAVIQSLEFGQPANAADLHALAVATIEDLAKETRDGRTDGWKDYWNVDQYERALTPRPENTCRNTILDRFGIRLRPLGINVVREGSHAMNTRSDIQFLAKGFNVPLKVKRSSNRDLWSAIRSQLISKYTPEPGAGGYGIYLVFWFGNEPAPCQMPESGTRPKSAAELEQRLRETLSPEEARLISVCVIDVARP